MRHRIPARDQRAHRSRHPSRGRLLFEGWARRGHPPPGGGAGNPRRHNARRRGAAFYVKEGRKVPIGPLGGAREPLVDTSPAAAAHARRAGRQLAVGVPLYLLSAATIIVGIASSRPPLHWTLIGSGAAGAATG